MGKMSAVGFEPTRSKTLRPERNPLDHSGKLTRCSAHTRTHTLHPPNSTATHPTDVRAPRNHNQCHTQLASSHAPSTLSHMRARARALTLAATHAPHTTTSSRSVSVHSLAGSVTIKITNHTHQQCEQRAIITAQDQPTHARTPAHPHTRTHPHEPNAAEPDHRNCMCRRGDATQTPRAAGAPRS